MNKSAKVSGELIVARSDAPPIFDAAEEVFDLVSLAIETLGAIGFLGGIAATWDDRQGTFVFDLPTRFFAVIGLVRAPRAIAACLTLRRRPDCRGLGRR